MSFAPSDFVAGDAPRRRWWHVLGKCLLVAALVAGSGIPLLMWLLLGIAPFMKDGTIILFYLPPLFSMPLVGALVAVVAVVYEVRFARLLVAGACLFLLFGPMGEFKPGGPLHGGEIIFALHALAGVLACAVAVPGLLLWRRKPAPPAEADAPDSWDVPDSSDAPNPWSRPTAYPSSRPARVE